MNLAKTLSHGLLVVLIALIASSCGGGGGGGSSGSRSGGSTDGGGDSGGDSGGSGLTAPQNVDDAMAYNSLGQSPTVVWEAPLNAGSGLDHYEYAIGSSVGATNVRDWTSVGTVTSFQATGLSLVAGNNYYFSVRAVTTDAEVSSAALGNGWLVDVDPPAVSASIDDTAGDQTSSKTPTLSWAAATDSGSGISSYEIAIGSSSGGTEALDWTAIGTLTSYRATGLNLADGTTYYASVRAVDVAGNTGSSTTSSGWVAGMTCPSGYLAISADGTYTSDDFCVMKFEAKAKKDSDSTFDTDGIGVILADYSPASVSDHHPWVSIYHADAATECASLGTGYSLITNSQWQTIARDAEAIDSNWTGASVESGCLHQGNNGNATCGYDGGGIDFGVRPADTNNRAYFTLSSGETIYDMAGNAWEWVLDTASEPYLSGNAYLGPLLASDGTSRALLDGVSRFAKDQFGPSSVYGGMGNTFGGYGLANIDEANGLIWRGGVYVSGNAVASGQAGLFAVSFYPALNTRGPEVGFRCTFEP